MPPLHVLIEASRPLLHLDLFKSSSSSIHLTLSSSPRHTKKSSSLLDLIRTSTLSLLFCSLISTLAQIFRLRLLQVFLIDAIGFGASQFKPTPANPLHRASYTKGDYCAFCTMTIDYDPSPFSQSYSAEFFEPDKVSRWL